MTSLLPLLPESPALNVPLAAGGILSQSPPAAGAPGLDFAGLLGAAAVAPQGMPDVQGLVPATGPLPEAQAANVIAPWPTGKILPEAGAALPPALPLTEPLAELVPGPDAGQPALSPADASGAGLPLAPSVELVPAGGAGAGGRSDTLPPRALAEGAARRMTGGQPARAGETAVLPVAADAAMTDAPAQENPQPSDAAGEAGTGDHPAPAASPASLAPLPLNLPPLPALAAAASPVFAPGAALPERAASRIAGLPLPAGAATAPGAAVRGASLSRPVPGAAARGEASGAAPLPSPDAAAATTASPVAEVAALLAAAETSAQTPASAAAPGAAPASPAAVQAQPSALALPERPAEPRTAAAGTQIESAIAQVGDIREALRAARPAMTLQHAEFGAVSLRLEPAAPDQWRAVLASRDPGFVPAIQAALEHRAVAAAEASAGFAGQGGPGQHGTGQNGSHQNGTGDQRYGASPNGGQGSSQPYPGQSGQRDGEAAPDHRRSSSTTAALAARGEEGAEDRGGPVRGSGGLFA